MKSTTKLLLLILISFAACKNKGTSGSSTPAPVMSTESQSSEDENSTSSTYADGSYCATVEYYNPNTGTQSTYSLTVEVEDNSLIQINWPNGGWLDDSHFSPTELDEEGTTSFTSDEGYEYTVQLDEEGPCSYSSINAVSPQQAAATHVGEAEGSVIWSQSGCNYVIIDIEGWYVVADKSYGAYSISRGDRVRGDLASFGFKEFYNMRSQDEQKVYVDNYYATKSRAKEKVADKCNLNAEYEY
jgi:hypothetical protein